MDRIGLFGGSFDPVHWGHLLIARAALEELSLDRLFFIPAERSPFKAAQPLAPAALRARMLRLALAGWCEAEIDLQEIRRGGVSYTIDTVRSYAERYPEARIHYLIGADHVPQLPKWRDAPELALRVEFAVVPRPGESLSPVPPPFRVSTLRGHPTAISSSEIRERVRLGRAIDLLTPPLVAQTILNNRLYL